MKSLFASAVILFICLFCLLTAITPQASNEEASLVSVIEAQDYQLAIGLNAGATPVGSSVDVAILPIENETKYSAVYQITVHRTYEVPITIRSVE